MSYQVIARRYRPQTFEEVIGQEHVSKTLAHSIENKKIAHAYLFSGPRGTGKTTTARILAKALNCIHGPTAKPCNECDICKSITDGSSIDVFEIDGATNRKIEDARQLQEYIQLAPSGKSKYRIYIIDEVHMLTTEAFNSLLKTIEEPPSHAIFVLATTEKHKVPITIISRCQQYDFKNISLEDIVKQLSFILDNEKNVKVPKEERGHILDILAKAGRGSMRDSESLLEQLISFSGGELTLEKTNTLLGTLPSELIAKLVDAILAENHKDALSQMAVLLDQGIEFEQLCDELLDYFRSLTILQVMGKDTDILDLTKEEKERRTQQAGQVKGEQIIQMMKLCTHSIEQLRKTVPGRVVMDLLVLDCIQAKQTLPLPELISQLKSLQKEVSSIAKTKTVETITVPRISGGADVYAAVLDEAETTVEKFTVSAIPSPMSTLELSLDNLQAHWGQIIEEIRQNKPILGPVLGEITPVKLEQNQVTLALDKSHKFHKSMLDKPENRSAIEEALEKYFGRALQIRTEVMGVPVIQKTVPIPVIKPMMRADAEILQDPIIQKAIEIFGATSIKTRIKPKVQETDTQEEEKQSEP